MARSTVYVYFANRDDLLRACVQSHVRPHQRHHRRRRGRRRLALSSASAASSAALLERIDESPAFFRLAMATQATAGEGAAAVGGALMMIGLDMMRLLEEIVVGGYRRRVLPGRPEQDRAVVLVGQQIYGALSVRAGEPDPIPVSAGGRRDLRLHPPRAGGLT